MLFRSGAGTRAGEPAYATWLDVAQLGWLSSPTRPVILRQAHPGAIWGKVLVDAASGSELIGEKRLAFITRFAGSPAGMIAIASAGPPDDRFLSLRPQRLYVVGNQGEIHPVRGLTTHLIQNIWWQSDTVLWLSTMSWAISGGPGDGELVEINWRENRILRRIHWPKGSLEGCEIDKRRVLAVCMAETLTVPPRLVAIDLATGRALASDRPGRKLRSHGISFRALRVRNAYARESVGFLALPGPQDRASESQSRGTPLVIMLYGFNRTYAEHGEWIGAYPVSELVHAGIGVLLLNFAQSEAWKWGRWEIGRAHV